jgi:hypothetical protein
MNRGLKTELRRDRGRSRPRRTKPISAVVGCGPGGRNVQNEPNSVRGSKESSTCRETSYGGLDMHGTSAKQSQFRARPGGMGPQGRGTRGRNAQNEPNSRLRRQRRGSRGAGRGGKCAKRSQFGPHRWNEAAVVKAARIAAGHKLRNRPNSQGGEPKRGAWNPPLYAGRTRGRRTCQFSLYYCT